MDVPDGMDKSWDHPWTTEEMRKKRREWSLAGDAGLLKHLQQFSENLISRANKTQESLDALTTQLNETTILIDNITNTSLALANTQFIESRVREDDNEIEEETKNSQKNPKDQNTEADIIASISDSVKNGLKIMEEKYKRVEVSDSDSEDEDDGIILSVMVEPNPYQDRPLPYVIGSEKWKASNKIGLETSSSESEQVDEEEEEESESEKDDKTIQRKIDINNIPKSNITRLSSSSTESDNYNNQSNNIYINNGKLDGVSQATINTSSESVTPNQSLPKGQVFHEPAPNFAEELAKRLGNVRQIQHPVNNEVKEPSINKLKDDLFATESEDVFSNKPDNRFNGSESIFDDQFSSSLWKDQTNKSYRTNVIPPSMDVPPPISTVSTKPKSAIDDLFGDADSDDSDDIFSSKSTIKKITKDAASTSDKEMPKAEDAQRKYLDVIVPSVAKNVATSTPETNINTSSLFSDEEDDGDLFSNSKSQMPKTSENLSGSSRKKPINEAALRSSILASELESKLSNRILRNQSSGSSGSDAVENYNSRNNTSENKSQNFNTNNSTAERSFIISAGHGGPENPENSVENTQSSGISIQPSSINNTMESSAGPSFQPEMTSTRLKSEEIYRERIASDSLFGARTRNPSRPNTASEQSPEDPEENMSSVRQDDVFENEDLFGPPPLPKSGSKSVKPKIQSLFDDSDSGDELFSTTSSGSRSQKSTDFLATTPQNPEKNKSPFQRKGLFDEDVDVFATKDSPDVDLFGATSKTSTSKEDNHSTSQQFPSIPPVFEEKSSAPVFSKDSKDEKEQSVKPAKKKNSLFDDEDDDADLFSVMSRKSDSRIFKNDETDDLFSTKKLISKEPTSSKISTGKEQPVKSKADIAANVSSLDQPKKDSDLSGEGLFSKISQVSDAHESLFDDEDYDDLFTKKETSKKEDPIKTDFKIVKETTTDSFGEAKPPKEMSPNVKEEKGKPMIESDSSSPASARPIISIEATEENVDGEIKKFPPKTLSIRPNLIQSSEENIQQPKRMVSGKIKDLMGKMGDFKVMSPTDKPPLWRKSEEKTDDDDDLADRDSDDGGCVSTQSRASPPTISEDSSILRRQSPTSADSSSNAEVAVSFDDPVQVETLSTASKSRVRIQAKRRPQSRHARKSALRHSGIDFDTVDAMDGNEQEQSHAVDSDFSKELSVATNRSNNDRLSGLFADNLQRNPDTLTSSTADDRSEISLSKESSMSANKNTLLSPSTDEEDLFDVPPDLPEDSQKEDSLFGRAPILSPVENVLNERDRGSTKILKDTLIDRTIEGASSDNESMPKSTAIKSVDKKEIADKTLGESEKNLGSKNRGSQSEKHTLETETDETIFDLPLDEGKQTSEKCDEDVFDKKSIEEPIDPLRDSSHDPLKDPSQLFAFVTKTPSPEKGKNLLFSEDDSLFSSGPRKSEAPKKVLDLFTDDSGGDLFSAPLTKSVMKPLKDTKITLFDDDAQIDEEESLFGSASKKLPDKSEGPKSKSKTPQNVQKKINLFDDDEDDGNLFADREKSRESSIVAKFTEESSDGGKSKVKDIFDDQSSGEDDIFAAKKIVPKKNISSTSLFDDDDDDGQIFAKPSSSADLKTKVPDSKPTVKKAVTRDLKKTAEKIVEDPLSLLQDD